MVNALTIVTGAGRGIGRAIALAQAEAGARLGLLARTAAEIEETARLIADRGGQALARIADVADPAAVAAAVAAVEEAFGPTSLMINNAGSFTAIGPVWEVDGEAWWRDVLVNARGAFNGCRAVLPGMLARGAGRIVNLVGGGAATSFPYGSGYALSKAGILRFTECLAGELAGTGVLAFALDPGLVRTAMTEWQLSSDEGQQYLPQIPGLFGEGVDVPPTRAARWCVEIGSGRFDRLAGRLLFAALDEPDAIAARTDEILRDDLRTLRVGQPRG